MIITTQISITNHANHHLLELLRSNLKQLDMRLIFPRKEIADTADTAAYNWDTYEKELNLFDAIAESSFHIVYNEGGEIDQPRALQIMYGMVKERPIILTHKPVFAPGVDAFARETITAHLKQLRINNLLAAELAEISFYLNRLPTSTSYDLTSQEETLIRSRVRAHFRSLVNEAKE